MTEINLSLAKRSPCCVKVLDYIFPLYSAGFALPDTNFARNSMKASYQGIVLIAGTAIDLQHRPCIIFCSLRLLSARRS